MDEEFVAVHLCPDGLFDVFAGAGRLDLVSHGGKRIHLDLAHTYAQ